jgi:hypothetical protein
MVPRRGFATKPTWRGTRFYLNHLSQDFCATKLWPKFSNGPQVHRTANLGAQEATTLLTVFPLRFSPPASCLNSAFRIDKKSPNPPNEAS